MKAAIVEAAGKSPVYGDFEEPVPAAGEQRVAVAAAALSQLVRGRAAGTHYSSAGNFPFVPGVDGVGRREDGARVYFVLPRAPFGAMAERTVVAAERCIAVPDGLDDVTAAAIANPGMSSLAALTDRARLEKGETVLVNGATGISGRLAVQVARHLGAGKVIATGRNTDVLASLGADVTIPLAGDGAALESAFKPHFADGIDVVLDYLWGPSAQALLAAAAKAMPDAVPLRFVQIGSMSGAEIALPGAALRAKVIQLMGSGIGSVSLYRLLRAIEALFQAAVPAGLTIAADAVPLGAVAETWAKTDSAARIVFTV